MTIQELIRRLVDGTLAAPSVGREQFAELDHSLSPSVPAHGYFFEPHSQLSSPIVRHEGDPPQNVIGAYSYVNGGGYLRDRVLIGRYCSIGRRVTIAAGNHAIRALSTSPKIKGAPARPYSASEAESVYRPSLGDAFTIIESDVWIGDGAVIKAGVRLAVGSVVGANAVVIRDTRPYEIVGGVAAKSLGFRFAPPVVEALLRSEWWERDSSIINRLPVANVFEFIERIEHEAPAASDFPLYRAGV